MAHVGCCAVHEGLACDSLGELDVHQPARKLLAKLEEHVGALVAHTKLRRISPSHPAQPQPPQAPRACRQGRPAVRAGLRSRPALVKCAAGWLQEADQPLILDSSRWQEAARGQWCPRWQGTGRGEGRGSPPARHPHRARHPAAHQHLALRAPVSLPCPAAHQDAASPLQVTLCLLRRVWGWEGRHPGRRPTATRLPDRCWCLIEAHSVQAVAE